MHFLLWLHNLRAFHPLDNVGVVWISPTLALVDALLKQDFSFWSAFACALYHCHRTRCKLCIALCIIIMEASFQALDFWILQIQCVGSIWFPHDEILNDVGFFFSLRALHSPGRLRGGHRENRIQRTSFKFRVRKCFICCLELCVHFRFCWVVFRICFWNWRHLFYCVQRERYVDQWCLSEARRISKFVYFWEIASVFKSIERFWEVVRVQFRLRDFERRWMILRDSVSGTATLYTLIPNKMGDPTPHQTERAPNFICSRGEEQPEVALSSACVT